jgi:hypothetical protein
VERERLVEVESAVTRLVTVERERLVEVERELTTLLEEVESELNWEFVGALGVTVTNWDPGFALVPGLARLEAGFVFGLGLSLLGRLLVDPADLVVFAIY